MKLSLISVLAVFLAFCSTGVKNDLTKAAGEVSPVAFADYMRLTGDTLVSFNSWQGASSEKYLLVPRDCTELLSSDIMAIPVPIESCVCMSTTYLPAIQMLGKEDAVKAVSGTRFIYDSLYRSRADRGLIADIGAETAPDYELILSLKADVVFAYGIEGSDNSYIEKLRKLGQKVLVINDYLESSVVGRLEYLKLFGTLLGRKDTADSLFNLKKDRYHDLASRYSAMAGDNRAADLQVLVNMPFKGIWYVPGKDSYMYELVTAAGGSILGASDGESASSRESLERMYTLAKKADAWIHLNSARTAGEVVSENPMFKNIPAVKRGALYNNVKRVTPYGGSDYWESGAVYPEEVLMDLIQVLHPEIAEEISPGRDLKYYIKLSD